MKATDDYDAKIAFWARRPKVQPLPKVTGWPRFGSRKFNSYEELNAWKQEMLDKVAKSGGVQWTKS